MTVRPAKTQISLGIRPVWSEFSLCTQWVAKDPNFPQRTAITLTRLGGCPGWSESSLGAQSFCWFYHGAAQYASSLTSEEDQLNPHLPSRPVHPYQLDESFSNLKGVRCTFFHFCSISAASDLGLHRLPMSQTWDDMLVWVNLFQSAVFTVQVRSCVLDDWFGQYKL